MKDVLKLALEALTIQSDRVTEIAKQREAITAIKEALTPTSTQCEVQSEEDATIIQYHEATIKRLETRIEEMLAQQEPVGGVKQSPYGNYPLLTWENNYVAKIGDKLYIAPPKRPWVSLTKEEILSIGRELGLKCRLGGNSNIDFDYAQAIETKLKEKNSGRVDFIFVFRVWHVCWTTHNNYIHPSKELNI